MSPAQTGRIEGPRDTPSYIPNQSTTPRRKLECDITIDKDSTTQKTPLRNTTQKNQVAKQLKS